MISRVLLFIAVLLAFGASITHGFHFDDHSVIHGISLRAWQTRPLTWLSFWINARVSAHPALWHLVSIVAHLCAVLLLYQLLLHFQSPLAAIIGAAIFAVHPIQAESVAYVFSRSTLFSTALSIGVCLFWVKGHRWIAVACFAFALMAKEDCGHFALGDSLFRVANCEAEISTAWSDADSCGDRCICHTGGNASHRRIRSGIHFGVSPLSYFLSQGFVVLRYLRLLILPLGFSVDPEISITPPAAIGSWVLVTILVALAVWKKNRWFLAGLLLLIPSSSIFPLADAAADHRMYLPMTAFAGLAGVWLARFPRYASALIIIVLIAVSATRMSVWASDERLWSEAVQRGPDKLRPYLQLSRALEPDGAIAKLKTAEARFPNRPEIDAEFGRVYLQMGQPALALGEFGKVLGQVPGDPHAINNRGVALRALGQEDAARLDFRRALKADPCLTEARDNLGMQPCR